MRLWRNWQTRYFEGVVFTRRVGSSPTNRTIWKRIAVGVHGGFFVSKRTEFFAHIWYSMMCVGTREKDTQHNALFRVSRY